MGIIMKKQAFTLIELLVVIAIIGLLLAVIVPSLNLAKRKAASAVCLVNVKNLSLAWYTYQEENNGRLVPPNPTDVSTNPADIKDYGWVVNPFRADGSKCSSTTTIPAVTDEDEIRGIQEGKLFPYMKAPDAYHCPGDNQRKSIFDQSRIFRSYSIPWCLDRNRFSRFDQIKAPGMRYNFVEEIDVRNYNVGTWDFYTNYNSSHTYGEWRDPIGINHGDSGILGFCDGHAEVHKWQEQFTKARLEAVYNMDPADFNGYGDGALNSQFPRDFHGKPATEDLDIQYMAKGWPYQGNR